MLPTPASRLNSPGRCQVHFPFSGHCQREASRWSRKDIQVLFLKLFLGFHLENGKGKLTFTKTNIFQFSFSQTSFKCSTRGKQVEWKPSHDGGKGSRVGPGLPLMCRMTVDHLPGPQLPVTEEGRQPVPLFSPLVSLESVCWTAKNSQKGGNGGLGCISQP